MPRDTAFFLAIGEKSGIAPPKTQKPKASNLTALLASVCQGVPGIDPATFKFLLSPEDVQDIEDGHIPVHTLNAYAQSFAKAIRVGRIKVLPPQARRSEHVCCSGCLHFERDTIGDGTGIGLCKIGGEGTGKGQPCLWPNVKRHCGDFEKRPEWTS